MTTTIIMHVTYSKENGTTTVRVNRQELSRLTSDLVYDAFSEIVRKGSNRSCNEGSISLELHFYQPEKISNAHLEELIKIELLTTNPNLIADIHYLNENPAPKAGNKRLRLAANL